jgi:hypothetical protein
VGEVGSIFTMEGGGKSAFEFFWRPRPNGTNMANVVS